MYPPVATKNPAAVQKEVQAIYSELYPAGRPNIVSEAFRWAVECFTGQYPGYQPIDARYHDLEHTMQGTLCMVRLLKKRDTARVEPRLSEREFSLGLLAILLHDTGYLKKRDDLSGTGAKYTITHVSRSSDFAGQLLAQKGYAPKDIQAIQNMIRCTGLNANLTVLPFATQAERITGYALATCDLLGQMAADDYVDKLPVLFGEFAEAAAFSGDKNHFVATFNGPADLVVRTPDFWRQSIRSKLDQELLGLWRFLNDPFPNGPNEYMDRIEANMERIRQSRPDAQVAALR
jgi:hypothetical protein